MLVNVCDECGRVIDINAKRCSYCGCPVETTFHDSNSATVPSNAPITAAITTSAQASYHNAASPDVDSNSTQSVRFGEAVRNYYLNYLNFKGKSTRSEFWWAFLYQLLISCIISVLTLCIPYAGFLSIVFTLTHEIPYLALTARRLHDVGKPTSCLLFFFLPIAGPFVVIYYALQPSIN